MHVLGFFHEMARPDRDESVKIHWENILEGNYEDMHGFNLVTNLK